MKKYKECYSLVDTVVQLTFVFLHVIFRGSPAFTSSLVLTKVTDSADSARPIHYSTFDTSPPSPAPSLSPTSSLTHVHRYIGSRHATRKTLTTCAKLTYLSVTVYDNRDGVSEHRTSPSPPSSLTHVHRCIGSRNATRQWQQRWRFWALSFPVAPLLTHTCTLGHDIDKKNCTLSFFLANRFSNLL
jgi:hypothetical protein